MTRWKRIEKDGVVYCSICKKPIKEGESHCLIDKGSWAWAHTKCVKKRIREKQKQGKRLTKKEKLLLATPAEIKKKNGYTRCNEGKVLR